MATDGVKGQLRSAYRSKLLNPLIRILIRNGVTAAETCELIKQVYVDAAMSDEFQPGGHERCPTCGFRFSPD